MYRLPQEQPHDETVLFRQPANWRARILVVFTLAVFFTITPWWFLDSVKASTLRCDASGACVLEGTTEATFRRDEILGVSSNRRPGKGCNEFAQIALRNRPSIEIRPFLPCAESAAVRTSIAAFAEGRAKTLVAEFPRNLGGVVAATLMFVLTCVAAAFAFKFRGDSASVHTAFIVSWLRRELLVQSGTGSQRYTFDEIAEIRVAFATNPKDPKVITAYGLALQTPDARGFPLTPLRPGRDNAFEGASALRRALRMRAVDDPSAVLGALGGRMLWREYLGRAALGTGLLMGTMGAMTGIGFLVQAILFPQAPLILSATEIGTVAAVIFIMMAPTALIFSAVLSKKVLPWRGP